jgi:nucleoid-associated protein YgaU
MRARLPLLLLLAAAALVVLPGVAMGGGSDAEGPVVVYVVEPGDTLWGIARRLDPDGDPRPVVDRLARFNDLGPALQAGQSLRIPAALAEGAAIDTATAPGG